MLGGNDGLSDNGLRLGGNEVCCVYHIGTGGSIIYSHHSIVNDDFIVFTLEEFWEKYPYKIGDVVVYTKFGDDCNDYPIVIKSLKWTGTTVEYGFDGYFTCLVKDLKMWKSKDNHTNVSEMKSVLAELLEHIKTTPKEELEREFEEIKEWSNVGPTVEEFRTFCECVNKKPIYPTTYEECLNYLGPLYQQGDNSGISGYYGDTLEKLQKLLICRKAYWKIAGEEMGLGKPWEPNWTTFEGMPAIFTFRYNIVCDSVKNQHCLLVFPTEEMRNAFYENFKDLIESCKELL